MIALSLYSNYMSFEASKDVIGSSNKVEYIPVISCAQVDTISRDLFLFFKPDGKRYTFKNTSSELLGRLNYSNYLYNLDLTTSKSENVLRVHVGKGYIESNEGKILLLLGIHNSKAVDFYTGDNSQIDISRDTILFLSTELVSSPEYATFYRRLQKIYIEFAYKKGIEVRIMPSERIQRNTFANDFQLKFNTITELDNHLQNEVGKLLALSDFNFRTINPGLNIPPIPVQPVNISDIVEEFLRDSENPLSTAMGIAESNTDYVEVQDTTITEVQSIVNIPPNTVVNTREYLSLVNSVSLSDYTITSDSDQIVSVRTPSGSYAVSADEDGIYIEDLELGRDEVTQQSEESLNEVEESIREEQVSRSVTLIDDEEEG